MREILDWLVAAARVPVEVRIDPARLRPADVPLSVCDASRLRAATGWEPRHTLEETALEILDWWRAEIGARPVGD